MDDVFKTVVKTKSNLLNQVTFKTNINLKLHISYNKDDEGKRNMTCIDVIEFPCTSSNRCIPIERINDHVEDCPLGEDEKVSKAGKCPGDFFGCSDGLRCLPNHLRCDGVQNCRDGSDETEEVCGVATMWRWSRNSSVLVPWSSMMRKLDFDAVSSVYGVVFKPEFSFSVGFKCLQRLTVQDYLQNRVVVIRGAVPQVYLEKGIPVCADQSDACYGEGGGFECAKCLDGVVISKLQICDGIFDCADLSDECSCANSNAKDFCEENLPVTDPQLTFTKACRTGMVEEIEGADVCETKVVEPESYTCANSTSDKGSYCDDKIDCILMDDECQVDCYLKKSEADPTKWREIVSSCFKFLLTKKNRIGFEFILKHAVNESSNKELADSSEVGRDGLCYSNVTLSFAPNNPSKSLFVFKHTLLSGPVDMSGHGGRKGCEEERPRYSHDLNHLCRVRGVECPWQHKCGPGEWVSANKVCDHKQDCVNWSDETRCSDKTHFYCESGFRKFVPRHEMVQGLVRCEDKSTTSVSTNQTATVVRGSVFYTTSMTNTAGENVYKTTIKNLNTNQTRKLNANGLNATFKMEQHLVEGVAFRFFLYLFIILVSSMSILLIKINFNSTRKLFPSQSYKIFKVISFLNVTIANLIFGVALLILGIKTTYYGNVYPQYDTLWRSSAACSCVGVMFVVSEIAATNLTAVILGWTFYVRLRPETQLKLNARVFVAQIIFSWLIALFIALVPIVMPKNFYRGEISITLPKSSLNNIFLNKNTSNTNYRTLTYSGYYNRNNLCFPSWFAHSRSESFALTLAVMLYIFLVIIVFMTTSFLYNLVIKHTNTKKNSFGVKRIFFIFFIQVISWIAILTTYVWSIITPFKIQTSYFAIILLVVPLKTLINSLIALKVDLFFKRRKSNNEKNDDVIETEMNTLDDVIGDIIDIRYTVETSE